MKIQLVCGTFDDDNGHVSKIGGHINDGLDKELEVVQSFNGGNLDALSVLRDMAAKYNVVIWMPNISNSVQTKYVDEIKRLNKKCILVISKNNAFGTYKIEEIINRALRKHANLILEIRSGFSVPYILDTAYCGRLYDPLGNVFCDWTENFYEIGKAIGRRTKELYGFTRFGSTCVGDAIETPEETDFFRLIREKAIEFHKLIPTVNITSRFLGNASFRCQKGFPSFRHGDYIFVSRRNVNKESIGRDGFVAVKAETIPVEYFGNYKPSVDAPSQLILYQMFPKVKYILHGHVYLSGFPMTSRHIPCGAIEEAHEIKSIFTKEAYTSFGINLRGHGFLAASDSVKQLGNMVTRLEARPIPEMT